MYRNVASIATALWCLVGLMLSGQPFAAAFATAPLTPTTTPSTTTLFASRRAVMEASLVSMASLIVSSPVWAADDVDDLAMPSEDEQKKSDEEAMKERLRRKAELMKAKSRPATFQESFKQEGEKQSSLKKSQTERRNAMCEELGRGC